MSSAKLNVPHFMRFHVHSPAVDSSDEGHAYTSQRHYPHELLEIVQHGTFNDALEYPGRVFYVHAEDYTVQWSRVICESKAGCTYQDLIICLLDLHAQMKKVSKVDARKLRPYNRVWKIKQDAVKARRNAVRSVNEIERAFLVKRRAEIQVEKERRKKEEDDVE